MKNFSSAHGRQSNLTDAELRGMKSLNKSRVNNGELVVTCTDKSSKIVLITPDLYAQAAQEHTNSHAITNRFKVQQVEYSANQIMKCFSKGFNLGGGRDIDRWQTAIKSVDS